MNKKNDNGVAPNKQDDTFDTFSQINIGQSAHWGINKIAAILKKTQSVHILEKNICVLLIKVWFILVSKGQTDDIIALTQLLTPNE